MEARVYYHDGTIETHRLPELVGDDLIATPVTGFGFEESLPPHNDLDSISDVIETFAIKPDGLYLSRSIEAPRLRGKTQHLSEQRIVPSSKLHDIKLVLLDGEQVWPTDQGFSDCAPCVDEIDGINSALESLYYKFDNAPRA